MNRYILSLALVALALMLCAVDAVAGTGVLNHLMANPEGLMVAPVVAAALPEAIKAELDKIGDQIKEQGEKALAEAQNGIAMAKDARAKVDELLTKQGELQARLANAEQLVAKLEQEGADGGRPISMGEEFVGAEGYQAFAASAARGGKFTAKVNAQITSNDASAGDLIVPQRVPGIVAPPNQQLRIRNLLSWGRTTSNSIEFVRETGFTNNAAPVSEGATKPESDITFEDASVPVVTIAHWIRATRQVLADVPMLQSYIDGRLRYGLKLVEDRQLLKGSGVGLNLNGIYTQAVAYANPGVVVQAENRMDRLRLALLQAELAEYPSDGIVLNPIDWTAIELTKNADNDYIYSNPRFPTQAGLWARPVVATKAMDLSEFLVGAFQFGAEGWDREDVNLTVALQDRDNVITNRVTLLVEERLALTVYRPEAFVKGDFSGLDPAVSSGP